MDAPTRTFLPGDTGLNISHGGATYPAGRARRCLAERHA